MEDKVLFKSGHTACAGCGQSLAARLVLEASGPHTIVVNNTGCLEVFSTKYPESAWGVPWIHSLFENAAAVASGVEAALIYLGKKEGINVIAQAGDGGTADIGLQALSGMLERGHDILYVCYDNEAYMNCLSSQSLILTKEGLKRITEVKVGDEVYAFDQNTHELVLKKCSGVFDNGRKEVFELKTLHHSIQATANHPFLVLKRDGRGKQNSLDWKVLEDIEIGDRVVTLKSLNHGEPFKFPEIERVKRGDYKVNKLNEINLPRESDTNIMKYLGIFVGDGWRRRERPEIGFALPLGKKARNVLIGLHKKIFASKISADKDYVSINSVNLAHFIDTLGLGQGAKNKTVPGWVFTLPQEQRETFVEGLINNKFFRTEEVVSIKSKGVEPTLDLRVEDEHNFIADGIVVHNTGIQRSGLTPFYTNTTTSPSGTQSFGNARPKKPMPEIVFAHGIPYVATCSVAFTPDLQRKVKKAFSITGPKYIQIHVPCPLGWRHETNLTLQVAKLAVETGLYPLIEYENGILVSRRQITPKPVEEYLKIQGRFKHILNNPEEIKKIQEIADNNIKKYGLSEA